MSEPTYLVDATAYLFRAHFSMRPIEAPDGTPVAALFGLGMTLQKFLRERQPAHVACVFDAGAHTFRNDLYPEYKANRGEPPEELVPQFPLAPQLTRAMGMATYLLEGFEADDLMATLSTRLRGEGHGVVLVSGDKDLAQLLEDGVELYDLARDRTWTAAEIPDRLGVRPDQVADLLALMGDSSDNIPGVPGVGRKGAGRLLAHFGTLEAIYERLDEVAELDLRGARSLQRKLLEHRALAELSRSLTEVRRDAPLEPSLDELLYEGADGSRLDSFAQRWGLGRVAAQVPRRADA